MITLPDGRQVRGHRMPIEKAMRFDDAVPVFEWLQAQEATDTITFHYIPGLTLKPGDRLQEGGETYQILRVYDPWIDNRERRGQWMKCLVKPHAELD